MSAPSAKAREIAEAWIPKKDDFSPFEGVPVIGPAVRRELAALIDAHLKDVREALVAADHSLHTANSGPELAEIIISLTPGGTP